MESPEAKRWWDRWLRGEATGATGVEHVWVWRRRARFFAKRLALITVVLASFMGLFMAYLKGSYGVLTVFFWCAVVAVLIIGILALEKVARELFFRRGKIKEGALAAGKGAMAAGKKSQSWVADGFKEEEDKRSADEQK